MNVLAAVDMDEVTRLTRAGGLLDATALLQAGLRGRRSTAPPAHVDTRYIDFEPSAGGDEAWQMPSRPKRPPPASSPVPDSGGQGTRGLETRVRQRPHDPTPLRPPEARFETRSVTNAAGTLDYKLYIPSPCGEVRVPLVVMLHGCTQNPDDFAAGTRMNELAELYGFYVAYPAQTTAANPSRCWNWFKGNEQRRDRGEPSLIADATRQIIAHHSVDPRRVFVAGLSAGGAEAAIMGCAYPDLYAGVGVHSGLACGAATDLPSALKAMRGGAGRGPRPSSSVRTIVFHGGADRTVGPSNADEVSAQVIAQSGPATVEHGRTATGMRFIRTIRRDADGRVVSEQWMVEGGGHAWFGGDPSGSYTDARGPDASGEMLRFFGITPLAG